MKRFLRLAAFMIAAAPVGMAQAQDSNQELMARGKYLMNSVVACINCHGARDAKGQIIPEKGLSGGLFYDEHAFKAYAANITPDKATGIGAWTDAQLGKAIREGIRPDGSLIGPPMPIEFYRHMSDNDLAAIIAYLKAQPAVSNKVPKSTFNMPLPPNYGPPVTHVDTPPATDKTVYGQYLATIAHCMECHTPRNDKGMLVMSKLGAGGQVFKGPWGESVSRNLTPDESGLKSWTDEQIAHAVRDGIDRKGGHYKPPMAFEWYKNINDADIAAIIAYLRSIPPQPANY